MEAERSFLGGLPPVTVNANRCGDVTVNFKVIIEMREQDSLRRFAERIALQQEGRSCLEMAK